MTRSFEFIAQSLLREMNNAIQRTRHRHLMDVAYLIKVFSNVCYFYELVPICSIEYVI